MKIALLSDIHGNDTALEAVLEDISKQGVTHTAVLGDIAYRGPDPKKCIEYVRELHGKVIKGNADEWIVRGVQAGEVPEHALALMQKERLWAYNQLHDDDIEYLNNLPMTLEIPIANDTQLFGFHAVPDNLFENISNEAGNQAFSRFTDANPRADYFVYGHIHLPFYRSVNGQSIINLGSVGLPFNGDTRASYVIIERDQDNVHVQFRRVSYDIDKACAKLDQSDYPEEAKTLIKSIYRNAEKPS
ncbi:metallophosphoesterase family protein [Salisediminibacterium halotolerans]|uniref:metallophosphoesterase family protein n=1 Tax=Salisediminibacterium halotolerans TaxID=517425 RepID=UPI000EABA698|nr:metallophosphoesterase family protein [Salisediminibacterium halotolerans]RLJ77895.1 putative phosphodiesterase [Actinophytocola xinjiangensis]RPE88767.1 putative phosphodiesterase [Salisediminibacterium halotolerans]TWG36872.1 putative phosphodiesterase [Salisediminibacterium halotolerans]GEL08396.1 serine/threonine protein phosphatase [Salisediminibacterium halotolerans]